MRLSQVTRLVSKLNHCVQLNNKKEFIHYNYTISDIKLLNFLLKHGYITSFNILDNKIINNYNLNKNKNKKIKNAIKITLKINNNKNVLKKIKNISTPGRILSFKYETLLKLYNSQN
jgi:ribosomal protein S8